MTGRESTALRVRVTDLRRTPGGREHLHREVSIAGAVGDAAVDDDPAVIEVDLEVVPGGIRARGTAEFGWVGSCRRCLGEARGRAEAGFEEIYGDPGAAGEHDGEEALPIEEGWIDLGGVVRDTVLLGLPLAPICRPDCPGPAPAEFPVGSEEGAAQEGDGPGADPRWAPLAGLHFDPEGDDPLP